MTTPARPTATWKLGTIGTLGGLILAVVLFLYGTENGETARRIGMVDLMLVLIAGGGWHILKRSSLE